MKLNYQFQLIQAIRNFFINEGFTDVMTPPIVENPGMEVHIHPFEVQGKFVNKKPQFLHTSPEFHMKELLTYKELKDIFTLTYCFRDEPSSPIHRSQFIMLEWYRKNVFYDKLMDDTENLIKYCISSFKEKNINTIDINKYERASIADLFRDSLNIEILDFLDKEELKKKIQSDFKDVPLPSFDCDWDDYYFLLFLNTVEPLLINHPYILLYDFPAPLSALSTVSEKDSRVCDRFEVYLKGVELCNCFNELTDLKIQKERFKQQAQDKKRIYGYELPEPKSFYESLEKGLPKSSGIALGVERLLHGITDIQNPFFK